MRKRSRTTALIACCLAGLPFLCTCGGKPPAAAAGEAGADACEDMKQPFFAETAEGSGRYRAQRAGAQPEEFAMPKPSGLRRVFVVGESAAAILDRGEAAVYGGRFRAWLSRSLPAAVKPGEPNAGIEIINCGMGGYDPYSVYEVLEEVLRYSPDLVVVLSGNNMEGLAARPCPGAAPALRRGRALLYQRLYALKGAQALRRAGLRVFGGVLDDMTAAAKKSGVPLLLCTLPANVTDMPPRRPLPFGDRRFSAGYKLYYEKKYGPALDEFLSGLAAEPGSAFLNFYAGKALESLGHYGEAKPYFFRALSAAGDGRSDPERNGVIRSAAARGGACVADLEKFVYALSPGGAPGFGQFTDSVHWRLEYNRSVWNEIFRSASACGFGYEDFQAADNRTWRESPGRDARKRLNYALSWISGSALNDAALAELSYLRARKPELLEEAAASPRKLDALVLREARSMGSASAEEVFPYFLGHLAETERRRGNYAGALALCGRAAALKPGDGNFALLRAQILHGLGRDGEAGGEFVRLTGPEYSGLKLAYAAGAGPRGAEAPGGKAAAALAQPQAVDSSYSRAGKVADNIALCFGAASIAPDRERALQACQDVAYLSASGELKGMKASLASDASLRSCVLLEALGRAEEARETLAWTVRSAPKDWAGLAEARQQALELGVSLE